MTRYSRRTLLKAAAVTGLAAACAPAAAPSPSPTVAPAGAGTAAPTAAKGLTGAIIVSYPDELGLKPKYVDQAAAAVKSANQ